MIYNYDKNLYFHFLVFKGVLYKKCKWNNFCGGWSKDKHCEDGWIEVDKKSCQNEHWYQCCDIATAFTSK